MSAPDLKLIERAVRELLDTTSDEEYAAAFYQLRRVYKKELERFKPTTKNETNQVAE